MSHDEDRNQNHRRVDIWKLLSQWMFLPAITFLLGCTGTYFTEVKDIREKQLTQQKDITYNATEITAVKIQADSRFENVTRILDATIRQNTEIIALIKVQQNQLTR